VKSFDSPHKNPVVSKNFNGGNLTGNQNFNQRDSFSIRFFHQFFSPGLKMIVGQHANKEDYFIRIPQP
jgi:hypothetical protein